MKRNLIRLEKYPMCLVRHIYEDSKVHILDLAKSQIELECGFKFFVPMPQSIGLEDTVDLITDLARKKRLIGPKDVIACFYN